MNKIVFQNKGVIDSRVIRSFGVSIKEEKPDGSSAIGQFGTGLKYAIAVLLRHGCSVSIYSGEDIWLFEKRPDTLRGKEFEFVVMRTSEGEEYDLGFTTELGKKWELWMAYRELFCNAKDESGDVHVSDEDVFPEPDITKVVVTGKAFEEVHGKKKEYFISGEPKWKLSSLEIYATPSTKIFYQGVLVYELDRPAMFTYNLLSGVELTEDRTVKHIHFVKSSIESAVAAEAPKELVERVVIPPQGCFEEVFNFTYDTPSEAFRAVVLEKASKLERGLNKSALDCCRSSLVEHLPKDSKELSSVDQQRLDKAIAFCHKLDFPVSTYPVVVTDWLGEGIHGQASGDKIYISTECFDMGTKYLASTLIEEYLHLAKGYRDETRELQTYLFNKIVGMGEQLTGEVL